MDETTVFLHNYSQLAEMMRECLGTLSALNQLSLRYLHENKKILVEVVDTSYYAYRSMQSLVAALSAAGDEVAKESVSSSREFSDIVERTWQQIKDGFSGNMPNPNHPLLTLDFVVGKETDEND